MCVKIGLNLTAHLFDVDVVRGADFDAAVAFVLGQGEPVRRAQLPPETLGAPLKGRHVFFLTPCRAPSGRLALVLIMRLYDVGPVDSFVLAEFADAMPLVQSVVVHVDYAADSIDYMSLDEHQLRCSAPQGEVHDP